MVKNKKRAVIYCRVSTDDQNCDRQVNDLKAFAERGDYEVTDIFKETASGAKNDRKERSKVMALAQARKIDCILITEMSRWGRSTVDLLNTLEELAQWGVSIIAETGMQFDMNSPTGKLIVTMLSGFSEFERSLLRERINSGLASARAKGRIGGRPKGNKTIAKHRKEVLKHLDEGKTYRKIAELLGIGKDTIGEIAKSR